MRIYEGVSICVGDHGESMGLRDGGHHLGPVRGDTARDGEIRPVEVFFDTNTKPQETGLGEYDG